MELWIAVIIGIVALFAALVMALFLLLLLFFFMRGPKVPAEIPERDRPMFLAALAPAKATFGMATLAESPTGFHKHDAHIFAAFYVLFHDAYLGDGVALTRPEREIVATAVSVSNRCYFCVHVHSRLVRASSAGAGTDELILERRVDDIRDPRERELARYGLSSKKPDDPIIYDPPFTATEVSDAAVLVLGFHYLNRVLDAVGLKEGIKRTVLANPPPFVLAQALGLRKRFEPGTAYKQVLASNLALPIRVDESDRETILRITRHRSAVADPILFAWSSIRQVAEELYDAEVLDAIREHLAEWDGIGTSIGMEWADDAVAHMSHSPRNQALARQGIIIAREAFRVSRVELFDLCDRNLRKQLALVCFSAFAAALRICEWLVIPEED